MCYPTTERPCQKTNIGLLYAIQFLKTSPKDQCEKQSFTSALDKVLLEKYHTNPRKTPIGRSHFSKIQSVTFSTLLKIEYTRYFFPRTLPDTQGTITQISYKLKVFILHISSRRDGYRDNRLILYVADKSKTIYIRKSQCQSQQIGTSFKSSFCFVILVQRQLI